jgi:hypothetical protein
MLARAVGVYGRSDFDIQQLGQEVVAPVDKPLPHVPAPTACNANPESGGERSGLGCAHFGRSASTTRSTARGWALTT